jgi:Xaa-Pro aminopeptidase
MIEAMLDAVKPGARHGDVIAAGMGVLMPEGGALYNSFMAFGRGGEKPLYVATGFPTWKSQERIEDGYWFNAGISGMVDGYYFDMARSKPVGRTTNVQVAAFETAIATVEEGVAAIRPGITAEEVARTAFAKQASLGFELKSDFAGMGHGIGLGWDAPWLASGDTTILQPGMVICVERTVNRDGYYGDFEETVLVTDTGAEKITDARIRSW